MKIFVTSIEWWTPFLTYSNNLLVYNDLAFFKHLKKRQKTAFFVHFLRRPYLIFIFASCSGSEILSLPMAKTMFLQTRNGRQVSSSLLNTSFKQSQISS